jgi:hypothetical protein
VTGSCGVVAVGGALCFSVFLNSVISLFLFSLLSFSRIPSLSLSPSPSPYLPLLLSPRSLSLSRTISLYLSITFHYLRHCWCYVGVRKGMLQQVLGVIWGRSCYALGHISSHRQAFRLFYHSRPLWSQLLQSVPIRVGSPRKLQ